LATTGDSHMATRIKVRRRNIPGDRQVHMEVSKAGSSCNGSPAASPVFACSTRDSDGGIDLVCSGQDWCPDIESHVIGPFDDNLAHHRDKFGRQWNQ
jgi:hypothetical protein